MEVKKITIIILLYCICSSIVWSQEYDDSDYKPSSSDLVDHLLANYSGYAIPWERGMKPVDAKLGFYIFGFSDISDLHMAFTLSYYLRMEWNDFRLKFNETKYNRTSVNVHLGQIYKLWFPDVFYRNEKGSSISNKIVFSEGQCNISSKGEVFISRKLETTFRCEMDLRKYPFDTQECSMNIGSYAYSKERLQLHWRHNQSVELDKDVELTSFELVNFRAFSSDEISTFGSHPVAEIIFSLKRYIGFYILQFYLPSSICVVLSWVVFWVEMTADEQVGLSILTLLTAVTISTGAQSSVPQISYLKAIDIWMFGCIAFIAASLVVVGTVSWAERRNAKDTTEENEETAWNKRKLIPRIAFPVCFFLCMLIYWCVYLA